MEPIQYDLLLFVAISTEYDELKKAAISLGLSWQKQASLLGDYWTSEIWVVTASSSYARVMRAINPLGSGCE